MDHLCLDLSGYEDTTRSGTNIRQQFPPPLLTKTKLLLEDWNKGLHSWFGRCNLIKMCILPKFLYLFQALPIKIPPTYFKRVQTLFTRFVWAHKKPCIPRSQLSMPKHYGGVALPDIRRYYHATHLGRMIDWHRHKESKLWAQLEQHQTNIPLQSAMWCYDSLPLELKAHPFIGNTIKQCLQATLQTSLTTTESPLTPILGNPKFPPGIGSGRFQTLRSTGCDRASQFVRQDRWPSIEELMDPAGPFTLIFWNAAQIHHFL